jgi:TctA family transporter
LELAARGLANGLSAGVVIGAGATAGAFAAYGLYRFLKKSKTK